MSGDKDAGVVPTLDGLNDRFTAGGNILGENRRIYHQCDHRKQNDDGKGSNEEPPSTMSCKHEGKNAGQEFRECCCTYKYARHEPGLVAMTVGETSSEQPKHGDVLQGCHVWGP